MIQKWADTITYIYFFHVIFKNKYHFVTDNVQNLESKGVSVMYV